ncbi:hypothetical protein LCGC14_0395490 [marine sediment metagenome]|uniref:Uncharacterized protein n=1 Tax=marine sediment metagenome TaxID=412755 RepID=A0A0F9W7G5_9ZZZZ
MYYLTRKEIDTLIEALGSWEEDKHEHTMQ